MVGTDIPLAGFARALKPPSGSAPSMLIRGRVLRVNRANWNNDDVTMLFDVALDNASMVGSEEPGVLRQVPCLMAGFGKLDNPINSPTGLVYIPEEGSRVLLAWDQVYYVIVGFYTGPAKTNITALTSSTGVSYNPGIEKSKNPIGSMTYGDDPDWLFGANPGDVIMGKGLARVKITSDAVVLGMSPNCLTVMKANEEKLERCKTLDSRMIGYYKAHRVEWGTEEQARLHLERPTAVPAPVAGTVTTEIFEGTPYPFARKALLVEQKGHVTDGMKDDARQSLLGSMSLTELTTETGSMAHTVKRASVLQPMPTAAIGRYPLMEMLVDHAETYSNQVDADGSWFIRGGQMIPAPGPGQRKYPVYGTLDSSMGFDAKLQYLHMAVGKKGVPTCMLGLGGPAQVAQLMAPNIMLQALIGLTLQIGPTLVQFTPNGVVITGPVTINGELTVNGAVTANGQTTANGVLAVTGAAAVAGALAVGAGIVAAGNIVSATGVTARPGQPSQKSL